MRALGAMVVAAVLGAGALSGAAAAAAPDDGRIRTEFRPTLGAVGQGFGADFAFVSPALPVRTDEITLVGGLVSTALPEQWVPGAQITLRNADTGAVLARQRTLDDGSYRFTLAVKAFETRLSLSYEGNAELAPVEELATIHARWRTRVVGVQVTRKKKAPGRKNHHGVFMKGKIQRWTYGKWVSVGADKINERPKYGECKLIAQFRPQGKKTWRQTRQVPCPKKNGSFSEVVATPKPQTPSKGHWRLWLIDDNLTDMTYHQHHYASVSKPTPLNR